MRPRSLRVLLVLVSAFAVSGVLAQAASACGVENTSTHAKFTGTLQEAVTAASGGNTLKVSGTCSGDTTIGKDLTITGKSAAATKLEGNKSGSVVTVSEGEAVTIAKLTITGGEATNGGGLNVEENATVTVESATFSDDTAQYGAGIFDRGVIKVLESTFTEGTAEYGGALECGAAGEVTITNSMATKNGGSQGVFAQDCLKMLISGSKIVSNQTPGVWVDGSVTLESTKVEGNVGSFGGGVQVYFGELTLINSSITGNESNVGGGIAMPQFGIVYLYGDSSVEGNHATEHGGGIYRKSAAEGTIVEEPAWTGKITNNTPENLYTVKRPPLAVTGGTQVTTAAAELTGTVNPEGFEVTKCMFEYGTSASYGSSVLCSPSPGSGENPVAVSASLTGLSPDTDYHYRVVAENSVGLSQGADETFATLLTSSTSETMEPAVPAKATDGELSVEASGGVGAITIGQYGSSIGGAGLAKGRGTYFQVYRSAGSTFTKIEYQDCELDGAKTLWWDDPSTGWEPIQTPIAVYTESPTPCITVTATESTRPSIAQLSDPRHVGGPAAQEQYGQCEPSKHGRYSDAVCLTEDVKKGAPKGKYEWFPAPVPCLAFKHGRYSDSGCLTEDIKKGAPKGKYEQGDNSFKVTGGSAAIKAEGQPGVECLASSGSSGLMRAPNQGSVTLTLTGCERQGVKCSSKGEAPGTIATEPLESYGYEEGGEYFTTLAAQTMMSFTCSSTEFRLSGTVAGQLKTTLNAPITSSEASFSETVGVQELELEETRTQARSPATLTTKTTTTTEQPVEIKVKT